MASIQRCRHIAFVPSSGEHSPLPSFFSQREGVSTSGYADRSGCSISNQVTIYSYESNDVKTAFLCPWKWSAWYRGCVATLFSFSYLPFSLTFPSCFLRSFSLSFSFPYASLSQVGQRDATVSLFERRMRRERQHSFPRDGIAKCIQSVSLSIYLSLAFSLVLSFVIPVSSPFLQR